MPRPSHPTLRASFFLFMSSLLVTAAAPSPWSRLEFGHALDVAILQSDSPRPPDPSNSRATLRLAWDDDGLLLWARVVDTSPREAIRASGAYLADSVEVFFSPDPARPPSLQLVLSPGHDPARPQPRAYVYDRRPAELAALPSDVFWQARPLVNGYETQVRMPWSSLGLQPRPGLVVGAKILVNDLGHDGTRTRFAWPSAHAANPYAALTLRPSGALEADQPEASVWLGFDDYKGTPFLNIVAPAASVGQAWKIVSTARENEAAWHASVKLTACGTMASASLPLPLSTHPAAAKLRVNPPRGSGYDLPDSRQNEAARVFAYANRNAPSAAAPNQVPSPYALVFDSYVFRENHLPRAAFTDEPAVHQLLGVTPVVNTLWLTADGHRFDPSPAAAIPFGPLGARTEISWPGQTDPVVVERLFYRLSSTNEAPAKADAFAAKQLVFDLNPADAATPHTERLAMRWWHRARRLNGWSPALPVRLHLPASAHGDEPTHAARAPRPLIVHLHGSGQATEDMAAATLATFAELAGPDVVVAYPLSPGGWSGPAVGELIDSLVATHSLDPERIYLIGFSLGGIGTWEVALDQPERFAAAVPIGGRSGSPSEAARLRDLPIWVINGADDPTTTPEDASLMVEALRAAGGSPRFTLLPGLAHGESQEAAYRQPGLFPWLLAQRRVLSSLRP